MLLDGLQVAVFGSFMDGCVWSRRLAPSSFIILFLLCRISIGATSISITLEKKKI